MHALIKSEAYYLTHDPVIMKWEKNASMKRQAESMRNRLQYTGKAYTNIFMLVMQENSVQVIACGRKFDVKKNLVLERIEEFLCVQDDNVLFQKFLAKLCAA